LGLFCAFLPPDAARRSPNWVRFAQSASDWKAGMMEYWNHGGTLDDRNGQNWVRFAHLTLPSWVRFAAAYRLLSFSFRIPNRNAQTCHSREGENHKSKRLSTLAPCCTNRDHYFWKQEAFIALRVPAAGAVWSTAFTRVKTVLFRLKAVLPTGNPSAHATARSAEHSCRHFPRGLCYPQAFGCLVVAWASRP